MIDAIEQLKASAFQEIHRHMVAAAQSISYSNYWSAELKAEVMDRIAETVIRTIDTIRTTALDALNAHIPIGYVTIQEPPARPISRSNEVWVRQDINNTIGRIRLSGVTNAPSGPGLVTELDAHHDGMTATVDVWGRNE